jgi:hypothetical protein
MPKLAEVSLLPSRMKQVPIILASEFLAPFVNFRQPSLEP